MTYAERIARTAVVDRPESAHDTAALKAYVKDMDIRAQMRDRERVS
jgi:hypothetical protein